VSSLNKTPISDPRTKHSVTYLFDVSPGYFTAAGTPLLAGLDVSFADTAKTQAVAVVNQQFAKQLFHSGDAVGRYFKRHSGLPIQIVGIVGDGKYLSLSEDPQTAAFFPISQGPNTATALIVRPRDDTADMAATIRKWSAIFTPPIRSASGCES
jgi:hypothetical protein